MGLLPQLLLTACIFAIPGARAHAPSLDKVRERIHGAPDVRPMLVVMEPQAAPAPSGWTVSGPAPRGGMMELTFAVRQRGLQELHDALMRVSRPSSPDYGKHLSNEEVNALTAPDPDHIQAVMGFLRHHSAEPQAATPNSDFISHGLG